MSNEPELITDDELVILAAEGDESAAARLYYRYAERVHRICWRIVLDTDSAQDCAQQVWINVFKSLQRYRSGSNFSAWITRIAVNSAVDQYRKKSRSPLVEMNENHAEEWIAVQDSAQKKVENGKVLRKIQESLNHLSLTQRTAFILRHYEGLTMVEIANVMNCSESTAKTHIHRAVLTLRKELTIYLEYDHEPKASA